MHVPHFFHFINIPIKFYYFQAFRGHGKHNQHPHPHPHTKKPQKTQIFSLKLKEHKSYTAHKCVCLEGLLYPPNLSVSLTWSLPNVIKILKDIGLNEARKSLPF